MLIRDLLGLPVGKNYQPPEVRVVDEGTFLLPGCKTGVELEYEGCDVSDADSVAMMRRGWKGKPDHSLREGGWEWVLTHPLSDGALRGAVLYALDLAERRGYQISVRTGLHTHTNALDMDLNQYKMQLLLYAFIEPAIYRYAGADRDENVHCLPWFSASDGALAVSDVYNASEENFMGVLRGDFRYGGLNLLATRKFGSVEWRHMKATLDPQKIMDWISINHRIKEAAIRLVPKASNFLDQVMSNPKGMLEDILREQGELLWYNGIEQECAKVGVQTMIDVIHRAGPKYMKYDWEDGAILTRGNCEALASFLKHRAPTKPVAPAPKRAPRFTNEQLAAQMVENLRNAEQAARQDWEHLFNRVIQNNAAAGARHQRIEIARNAWRNAGARGGDVHLIIDEAMNDVRLEVREPPMPEPEPDLLEEDVPDEEDDPQ